MRDNELDVIKKMSEMHAGAMDVMEELSERQAFIDPNDKLGYFGTLMQLDECNIYGARIWRFYDEHCKKDLVKFLGALRAEQQGIISSEELISFIDTGSGIDLDAVLAAVQEQLPRFGRQ